MSEFNLTPTETLYYEFVTPKQGMQTYIFVNALTGNTEMWSGMICKDLQKAGYGTLCFNFRGQTNTTFSNETRLTPNLIVEDICALIEYVKPPSPILVGLSIGGLFAAQAHLAGCQAIGLVLINTLRKPSQRLDWINKAMVDLARIGGSGLVMKANFPVIASPPMIASLWDTTFNDDPPSPPPANDGLFRLMEGSLMTDWDFSYEQLQIPVLILTGEYDRLFRIDNDIKELKGRIASVTEKRYPNAGHLIPLEEPTKLIEDLLGFAHRCVKEE